MLSEELIEKNRRFFINYLATQGLRLTNQRRVIFDEFMQKDSNHFDIETLFERARKQDKSIGLATIYRTVKLLVDAGIVQEVNFDNSKPRYEAVMGKIHHDHLVCEFCGKNIEFNDPELEEIQVQIALKYKFKLTSHVLNLFGICEDCRNK